MDYRTPLHLSVVAIEKGAFGLPSTKVANFYYPSPYTLFFFLRISFVYALNQIRSHNYSSMKEFE